MQFWLYLILAVNPVLVQKKLTLTIPGAIYTPVSMAVTDSAFFILDDRSFTLVKVDRMGRLVAKKEGQGQAPGEFINPYSVGVGNGKVFVGDVRFVHIFQEKDLKYLSRFKTFNNSISINSYDNELFLGINKYPNGKDSCYVFSPEGKELRSFYKHGIDDTDALNLAYMDQGSDGALYFLQQEHYRVDILDRFGETVTEIKVQPSPLFQEVTPIAPFNKRYGMNMSAYKHWQTAWTMPKGIAIERDRYLWLCFSKLEKDLRTYRYFVEIYDIQSGKKVLSWKKMDGRLFDGGPHAYFIEERDSADNGDFDLKIVGYSIAE